VSQDMAVVFRGKGCLSGHDVQKEGNSQEKDLHDLHESKHDTSTIPDVSKSNSQEKDLHGHPRPSPPSSSMCTRHSVR